MAKEIKWTFGGVGIGSPGAGPAHRAEPGAGMRILIIGDFAGRADRLPPDAAGLGGRKLYKVDRDDLDQLFARLGVGLALPVGRDGGRVELAFASIEDLHPDALVDRLEIFSDLRALRRRLSNSTSFAAAAAEMSGWAVASANAKAKAVQATPVIPATEPPEGGEGLLDAILGETAERGSQPSGRGSGSDLADSLIRAIIAPHVEPVPDPRQADMIAAVDGAVTDLLRAVLHHPAFRALEASWRALEFAVRRIETASDLTISVLDVTKAELIADLMAAEDPSSTGLYKHLVARTVETPGGKPWSLIVGDYRFGANAEDADLLGRMGHLVARAGSTFLSAGDLALAGCRSPTASPESDDWTLPLGEEAARAWTELRSSAEGSRIALLAPRVLLRLPYGSGGSSVDLPGFEEIPLDAGPAARHHGLLWGNPAYFGACLVAEAFRRTGRVGPPTLLGEIDGLPVHTFKLDGDVHLLPSAELLLDDKAAEKLQAAGLTAVRAVRNADCVRVGTLRPLKEGSADLLGPWS